MVGSEGPGMGAVFHRRPFSILDELDTRLCIDGKGGTRAASEALKLQATMHGCNAHLRISLPAVQQAGSSGF